MLIRPPTRFRSLTPPPGSLLAPVMIVPVGVWGDMFKARFSHWLPLARDGQKSVVSCRHLLCWIFSCDLAPTAYAFEASSVCLAHSITTFVTKYTSACHPRGAHLTSDARPRRAHKRPPTKKCKERGSDHFTMRRHLNHIFQNP